MGIEDRRGFLATRRARTTSERVDIPSGGKLAVPCLRRYEVALRAGMSVDPYVRLERGKLAGASEKVFDAVACAPLLDDGDWAHHEWDVVADDAVAVLRAAGEAHPQDRRRTDLIGGLTARSEEGSSLWARRDARQHLGRVRRFHHRTVADIVLTHEAIELVGGGLTLIRFTPDPDSAAGAALLNLDGGD